MEDSQESPYDISIIPPPSQFEDGSCDEILSMWSSSSLSSSYPGNEAVSCSSKVNSQQSYVNMHPGDPHLTPTLSQTMEFIPPEKIQQNSSTQKFVLKDEKLQDIERLFDQHLQDCMSNYLLKRRTPPPVPLQDELVALPIPNLPPPSPKSSMQSSPSAAGRGRGTPTRLQTPGGGQQPPPGGGGGRGVGRGGGGGSEGHAPGAGGGPGGGEQPQPPPGPARTLKVTTTPAIWAVQDNSHTKATCNPAWIQKVTELYKFVLARFDGAFEWLDDQGEIRGGADQVDSEFFKISQFMAMMVTWVARQDTPGSMDPYDQLDLFDYSPEDGFLTGSSSKFEISNVLSGVQFNDPRNTFSPVEHLANDEVPDQVHLRPALVLFYHLLQDLNLKNVKLEVKLQYNGNNQLMTVKYNAKFIHDILAPAILHVATIFDSVFTTQSAARRLGRCLREIDEDVGRKLEEMVCQFSLSPESVDHGKFQSTLQTKLADANRALAAYEEYEEFARKTSEGFSLTNQLSQQTFDNLNMTIKFLDNCSEPTMPWIQNAGKFCTGVVRVTLGDERLKMLHNPSRLFLPKATTGVDDQVEVIKKLVHRGGELWMENRASSRPVERGGGVRGGDRHHEEDVVRLAHPPGPPPYPSSLLADAASLNNDILIQPDLRNQDLYIIQDYLERVQICIKEIQRCKWQGLLLAASDEEVFSSLSSLRPMLSGYISELKQQQRNDEAREREVGRNVTMSSPPKLDDDGTQIQEFIQFHRVFSSASPLARTLKIRQGLSKNLTIRCQNMTDPDEILELLSSLFLQEDILLPKILLSVQQLKGSPPVNSKIEAENFCAINGFISKLKAQDLLHKLDYTTMQICLSRLSRVRCDEFERSWYSEQVKVEKSPSIVQEQKKREVFLSFIQVNERLIHRRLLQNSMTGEREKKSEKVFSTNTDNFGRETRYDKRQRRRKDEGPSGGEGGAGPGGRPSGDVTCPMPGCQAPGHPRVRPPNVGGSVRNLSRCPILRATSQEGKLRLVESVGGCKKCLNASHTSSFCSLPDSTPWLKAGHGPDCKSLLDHHPSICPKQKPAVERSNVTMIEDSENSDAAVVVNLAERVTAKDLSGRSHYLSCIHDSASDSSWCSSEIAASLPPRKKHKVTLNLSTISGVRPFQTYQHTLQIETVHGLKKVHFYETPNIGEINKCYELENYLDQTVEVPIELLDGKVDLLFGLKAMACYPVSSEIPSPPGAPDLKIFSSSLNKNKFLAAGSVDTRMLREGGLETQRNSTHCLYTKSHLMESILKDREIDEAPPICSLCQERCKQCSSCQLAAKPMSLAEIREIEIIRKNMVFDKKNKQVCTKYEPTISTFKELFPKHLSNEKAARSISSRMLTSLKKSGELEIFHNAFTEMVDKGIVEELSEEAIKKWDDQDGPINYISFHSTFKDQASKDKIQCRVVTNSSLPRYCQVGDKKVKSSLNSLLPQGAPRFQSITDVLLRWIVKPVSMTTDLKGAYTTIRPIGGVEDSQEWIDGQTMRHIRRLVWYKQPQDTNPQPTTYCLARVHWGDSCAAGCLQELVNQVSRDLKASNKELSSTLFQSSSFVDDNICGVSSPDQGFSLFKDIEDSFKNYNGQLHTPIICSKEGKFDHPGAEPRKFPDENETQVAKTLGFSHNFFEDKITIELNRNLNKRTRGLRPGKDMDSADVSTLKITQRTLAGFQQSQFDVLNLAAPVLIRGKILLSRVQELLNPSIKENWDCSLPEDLEAEAREYINTILTMTNPSFDRFSPPGELRELIFHHDGSAQIFASVVFGVFIEDDGSRHSKLLYSKPRISHRTVPDIELQSFHQTSEIARSLVKLFPDVVSINSFGDSASAFKQVSSLKRPKCVFTNNKIKQIISNFQEIKDAGVTIRCFQVGTKHNMADKLTKYIPGSENFVHSEEWKQGPRWFCEEEDNWPTVRSYYLGDGVLVEEGHEEVEQDVEEDSELPVEIAYSIEEDDDHCDGEENSLSDGNDGGNEGDNGKMEIATETSLKIETNVGEENVPMLSQLLNNVSNIRLAARVVARIKTALRKKSFSVIKQRPTVKEEREAFTYICQDQQRGKQELIQKGGMKAFEEDGTWWTRQRWSNEMHLQLFGVDKLPVVALHSRLGALLLQRAHRPPNSPCLTDDHAKSSLRTGSFQAFLCSGSEKNELRKIRNNCVACKKMKLEIKGGELSNFKPEMKGDEFKSLSCPFFSRIAIDTTGPAMVCEGNSEDGVDTRGRKRYQKRHILIISDLVGSGGVRFKQISSTSAAAVVLGLQQHIAEVGQTPEIIYHDSATSFRSIATKEGAEGDSKREIEGQKREEEKFKKAFPSTTFRDCGSSSQYRNAISERGVFFIKRYIRSSLGLKPNSPLPKFTCFGLNYLLSVAENVANGRPLTYLRRAGTYITPHHLLRTSGAAYAWEDNSTIEDKYSAIQEYKTKMLDSLVDGLKQLNFLPQKWKQQEFSAKIGDFIMISRGKSKICPLGKVEFGIVEEILDDGRSLKVKVARANTKNELVRELNADSRNCYLIHREEQ